MKTVLIQKGILSDLKPLIDDYNINNKPKLKLDVAVFFIGLLNEVQSEYRVDEIERDEYTPLYSVILKHFHSNYKKYFIFLIKNGILDKDNYGADIGQSNSFKICDNYKNDELEHYDITYQKLLDKFNDNGLYKHQEEKFKDAYKKRPHLLSIFNDELTINDEAAIKEIEQLKVDSPATYLNASIVIEEIKQKRWKASIKPYTDNRLHTNLTRTPKIIRKHILIEGEHIVGCDIKTSQPYFFCVVLKAILKKDKGLLETIKATKVLNGNTIEQLFDIEVDRKELIEFVQSVINEDKDLYDDFKEKLEIKIDENGQPYRMVSTFKSKDKGKKRRKEVQEDFKPNIKKTYETKRDLAKQVIMEIFYSSPMSPIPEAVIFRREYPSIHKIIKCIDDNDVKFSQLLTTIESHVLLDIVAKQFKEKFPHIPLASIHDCLITTTTHHQALLREMKLLIEQTTSLKVKVDLEQWT